MHNLQAKREFYATLIYFNIYGFIIIHRHKIGGKQEGRFVNGGDIHGGREALLHNDEVLRDVELGCHKSLLM